MTDRGAGAFSLSRARCSVGQLAQTRTAKHRAVGMATEEHFPPNSARAATEAENKREWWRSVLLLKPFVIIIIYTRRRSGFSRGREGGKAGHSVRPAALSCTLWSKRSARSEMEAAGSQEFGWPPSFDGCKSLSGPFMQLQIIRADLFHALSNMKQAKCLNTRQI